MLKKIKYPVEPHDIILMGQTAPFERTWTISPLRRGDYSMIIHPKGMLDISLSVFRFDIFSNNIITIC